MLISQTENYNHSFSFSLNGVQISIRNNSSLFTIDEAHYCGTHQHHVAELHYVYSGSEIVTILNRKEKREDEYNVEAGQLLIVFPQTYHALLGSKSFSRLTFTVEAIEEDPGAFSKKVVEAFGHQNDKCRIIEDKYLQSTFG